MPRDVNGNYSLPAGNPVVTDTNIESTWANNTMGDLATEMTDSLSRSGKGGVTAPFQIVDESAGVPGLAFANEPTSGVKRAAGGDVRMQVLGNDRMRWRSGPAQPPEVQINAVWKEVAALEAGKKVMQGTGGETAVWFYNATVPAAAGWSPVVPDANVRSLMIGGVGGSIAGTQDPSSFSTTVSTTVTVDLPAATGGHALTAAENGPHNHFMQVNSNTGNAGSPSVNYIASHSNAFRDASNQNNNNMIANSGSGTAHTHPIGGTAAGTGAGNTGTVTPRYAMGILGQLDA